MKTLCKLIRISRTYFFRTGIPLIIIITGGLLLKVNASPVNGCTDPLYCEFDPYATVDDGSCFTLNSDSLFCNSDCMAGPIESWSFVTCSCETVIISNPSIVFPPYIELSILNGTNGFTLNGIDQDDFSGFSVSSAGDINNDGYEDVIIGAYSADANGSSNAGESYVVFGSSSFSPYFDLSSLNGSNGFIINGIDPDDLAGISVSAAGDVNDDGIDDVILGARWADPNGNSRAGESYIIFGNTSGFTSPFNLSSLNGTNGFVINGVNAEDFSGYSVSNAGDINADGIDDIIVGAYYAEPFSGIANAGESYLIFGTGNGFASEIDLSSINGTNGVVFVGIDYADRSGITVNTAGDVNADGIDDLIIGAAEGDPNGNSAAGETYIVYGKSSGFTSPFFLSTLNGSNGFIVNGIDVNDFSGISVSTAGDINADGIDDIIIGAHRADQPGKSAAGESYVIFGNNSGFTSPFSVSTLNGSNGFKINGIDGNDLSGFSVSNAGDVNGDGIDDIIIGAHQADGNFNSNSDAGESYVVYGKNGPFPPVFYLSSLYGAEGFKIFGATAFDYSGRSVSDAGDVNGDGYSDIIIGAYGGDPNGNSSAGESYIIFGRSQYINGCTNANFLEYDPFADCDDGSCLTPFIDPASCQSDCSNGYFVFYDPLMGQCDSIPGATGCTDETACNFDPTANCDDGSCILFFSNEYNKIVASDRSANDNFGIDVAINGNIAVIGAFLNKTDENGNNTLNESGAAYIFERDHSGNWNEIQKIVASDRAEGDVFGISVAIHNNTIIIGATRADDLNNANDNVGAAYIFEKNNIGTWVEVQKIMASDKNENDLFGDEVKIQNDIIVVGAFANDYDDQGINFVSNSGACYIFQKDSLGFWNEIQKIVSSNRDIGEFFGSAIDIEGDHIVIGAPGKNYDVFVQPFVPKSGAIHIFEKDGFDNWIETQNIYASDKAAFDNFGNAVAISGNNIIVGSYFRDNVGLDAGAVYFLEKNPLGIWVEIQTLLANDNSESSQFGASVDIWNDIAIVGANIEDFDTTGNPQIFQAGAAYIINKDANAIWVQTEKITAIERFTNDQFGAAVAIENSNILVSARLEDEDENEQNTLNNSGSVYIRSTNSLTACDTAFVCSNGVSSYQYFNNATCQCDTVILDPYCISDCSNGILEEYNEASCSCESIDIINGCTNPFACNFDPDASCDDGSCIAFYNNTPFECPQNISAVNDPLTCGALAEYDLEYDPCYTSLIQTEGLPNGSFFPVGLTSNSFIVSENGSSYECNFSVYVFDTEDPVINCPDDQTIIISDNCAAALPDYSYDLIASDNCSLVSTISQNPVAGSTIASNSNTLVTMVVLFDDGSELTCSFNVSTVINNDPPTALCKDTTLYLDASGNIELSPEMINDGSIGSCGLTFNIIPDNFNCNNIGTNAVDLIVQDGNGNQSTCSATVSIIDDILPECNVQPLTIYLNEFGNAIVTAEELNLNSYDACGLQLLSVSPPSFNCESTGTIDVTLAISDFSGNINSCVSKVEIVDSIGSCSGELCGDGIQNGDELGIDCGGDFCGTCNGCPYIRNYNNETIPDGTDLNTSYSITTTNSVNVTIGSLVALKAGNHIELNAGFQIDPGSEMELIIEECP